MVEREPPRSGRRRAVLALLALSVAGASCAFEDAQPGDPQLLYRSCHSGDCMVTGAAERKSGLTHDTVGFRLGPGAGKVSVPMRRQGSDFVLEFMLAGRGTATIRVLDVVSRDVKLTGDYRWHELSGTLPANTSIPDPDGGPGLKDAVVAEVEVAADGSNADLVDLRAVNLDHTGCSVAQVGARRR